MANQTAFQVKWANKPGVLRTWLFPVGQSVRQGAALADCEPRGVELRSPVGGQLQSLLKKSGDRVEPDEVVALIQLCSHSVQYGGLCAVCGMDVKEFDKGTFSQMLNPISTALKVTHEMAKELSIEKRKTFLKSRRLALVLDLDKTILHTTDRREHYTLHHPLPDLPDFYHFTLPDNLHTGYFVKFRPHLREFLISISVLYEIHVYTAGDLNYATKIIELVKTNVLRDLEPSTVERIFGERVITRTHTQQDRSKDLSMIFPHDQSMIVILDDREDVWPGAELNLINIHPYEFFEELDPRRKSAMSATAAAAVSQEAPPTNKRSHSDAFAEQPEQPEQPETEEPPSKRPKTEANGEETFTPSPDEIEAEVPLVAPIEPIPTPPPVFHPDGLVAVEPFGLRCYPEALGDTHLLLTLELMIQIHKLFFDGSLLEEQHNTKDIMAGLRRRALLGCSLLFTHVFPVTKVPFEQPIWKLAERYGAKCHADWSDNITHVVAGDPGTAKVREALQRESVFLVSKKWLEASIRQWKRADEFSFPLGNFPVCLTPAIIKTEDPDLSDGLDELSDLDEYGEGSDDDMDDLAAELESDIQTG